MSGKKQAYNIKNSLSIYNRNPLLDMCIVYFVYVKYLTARMEVKPQQLQNWCLKAATKLFKYQPTTYSNVQNDHTNQPENTHHSIPNNKQNIRNYEPIAFQNDALPRHRHTSHNTYFIFHIHINHK